MLPIDPILPDLVATLRDHRRAVLQAPPGAGKTTRVPLAILDSGLVTGRIIMLEPRRLAARAAAARMAETLEEPLGDTVGYRIRGETRVSDRTRIEVVTEGILTRMLQSAPDLPGVGAVIFDEFHERSLNADLGLAFALEVAEALREDLILLAMSATLDAAPVAEMMRAPILTAEGRAFPVETRWLERPVAKNMRFEDAVSDLTMDALHHSEGAVLVFLPGEGEIHRVRARLESLLTDDHAIRPLYGALDLAAQRAALKPIDKQRKIVLATAIAETSLTIPDIRVVVDGGRSRRAVFDPASSMSRLVTERVTRAEATQRAGRAGRTSEGMAFKLWTRGEDGALAAYPPPEIEVGDLTGLALELALWGGSEDSLRFVTPPHAGRLAEARALLRMLGALDQNDRITEHGRALARQPLHPRLSHMLELGGAQAADLAAVLNDRDPVTGAGCDLRLRLGALRGEPVAAEIHRGALDRIRQESRRLRKGAPEKPALGPGALAALAYPDRIGLRRKGDAPRFVLSGGKGAVIPSDDPLASERMIVATNLDGDPREARIRIGIPLAEAELRALFADSIAWHETCAWSARENRVIARRQEKFGTLVLDDRVWRDVDATHQARAMIDGVQQLGLLPSDAARRFIARVRFAGPGFPDMSDATLMARLEDWLLPFLTGVKTAEQWKSFDVLPALEGMLDWDQRQQLDRTVPSHFETPLGRRLPIDYSGDVPAVAVRVQELFGVTVHPMAANRPIRITLLSPAGRPLQVTTDLPGFWSSSYADVRKDMRGRYPKHPWPEDPTVADPTLRTKRRS